MTLDIFPSMTSKKAWFFSWGKGLGIRLSISIKMLPNTIEPLKFIFQF